ncbi:hypothetical protein [Streptomyces genisteinicus]|uniref:Secreted protein n=1 Tax=Streptomyces genisteinicus TaxID=2768068 RepID=A0A7H0I4P4_9ACTN|nr:hypothetical protein [Streptomyces genisteinicus]QNP67760.1 hypothetical protein IAG43_32615 [Streptomyces genisteinicus]
MSLLNDRLDALRGPAPAKGHDARTLAALTTNPGCARRALMDAAGVDKDAIAVHLGKPRPLAKSSIALRNGAVFEQKVKADGGAELLRLLRDVLGLPLHEAAHTDLAAVGSQDASLPVRHAYTRTAVLEAARSPRSVRTLLDHPILQLTVAGHPVYLEPDVVAFQVDGVFHIIEIKSFAVLDGRADPAKVAAAVTQAAAYVIALRELLESEGLDGDNVSHDIILITPRNFSRNPTASIVDARKKIAALTRQLNRLTRIGPLLDALPPHTTFDLALDRDERPTRDAKDLTAALQTAPARYTPTCRHFCDLAYVCRSEARDEGLIDVLGSDIRDDLGGVDHISTALRLADDTRRPAPDQADLAAALRHAHAVRTHLRESA